MLKFIQKGDDKGMIEEQIIDKIIKKVVIEIVMENKGNYVEAKVYQNGTELDGLSKSMYEGDTLTINSTIKVEIAEDFFNKEIKGWEEW